LLYVGAFGIQHLAYFWQGRWVPGRAALKIPAAMIGLALLAASVGAMAQSPPANSPTPNETCPPPNPAIARSFASFTEAMLAPNKGLKIADLIKDMGPDAMGKIAEFQKAEAERQAKDWPNLCRYAAENASVLAGGIRPRVVFIGDSITENWKLGDPSLFSSSTLDRGISGQTTPQILLRFYQDVVALRPRVVHIMAGTNDISGNTGPMANEAIVDNIRAMIDIAKANNIRVVLASITPSKGFVMRPGFDPSPRIAAVNQALARLAAERRVTWVDYFPPLADSAGGFNAALANDGLHPNRAGYAVMRPLTDKAIARAAR
jgi:lysophospholipase L1-like esterase